jgi:hypothetical protein
MQRSPEPEVDEHAAAIPVLRLDQIARVHIEVQDPLCVEVVQGFEQVEERRQEGPRWLQRSVGGRARPQWRSIDVLARVERPSGLDVAEIERAGDLRVPEACEGAELRADGLELRLAAPRVNELERHAHPQLLVVGEVDRAQTSGAELAQHLVTSRK